MLEPGCIASPRVPYLRKATLLGSQMACNAIFSVCTAYRSQRALGHITEGNPVPRSSFNRTSVHFDRRTYTLKGEASVSLNTLNGRTVVRMILGHHQLRILRSGTAKEAHVSPAYTSQSCSACGRLGTRRRHRFECSCGFRAHADLNAGRNLARIGETAVSPRAVVSTPNMGRVACHTSP